MNLDLFGNEIFEAKRKMKDYFGIIPFNIFDTTSNSWQKRKMKWDSLIKDDGNTRFNTLKPKNKNTDSIIDNKLQNFNNGVSLLDSCMSEILVKWFSEKEHEIFDPFAGDTVFGFVCGYLKRQFTGIELREEQIKVNQEKCNEFNLNCKYICDTSENMDLYINDNSQDLIFSCPPYADLEKYSNLKEDLSTMSHTEFFKIYTNILTNTYRKLKNNRFVIIVTSEVRDGNGIYIGLVPKTIDIMQKAGYKYYNEIILMNSVGTLPLRVNRFMNSGRKIGRRHQNILIFYKGDPKEIKNNYSELIPRNGYYGS